LSISAPTISESRTATPAPPEERENDREARLRFPSVDPSNGKKDDGERHYGQDSTESKGISADPRDHIDDNEKQNK
jgi:hypothetical protein